MKNLFFSALLALMVLPSVAQTPLLKPADFSTSLGMSLFSGGRSGSIEQYFKNSPNSSLLKQDYSGFNRSFNGFYEGSSNGVIAVGFNLRNKEKTGYNENRILRLGLSFGSSSSFTSNYYKQDIFPTDTFTSGNGNKYPVDSNRVENLSMSVEAKQIVLDAALIFRTSSSKRWKLFAGLGVQAGVNFNGISTVIRNGSSYLSMAQGGYFPLDNEQSSSWSIEQTNVSPGFAGAVYIPLGIDFQTGTQKPFFKNLHLFYEMRPSLTMVQHSGYGTEVKTGLNQQLGIRVRFTN